MKEPKLLDFNLTENEMKLYEQQREKYESACKLKRESHHNLFHKILIVSGILIGVSLLSFFISLAVEKDFGGLQIFFIAIFSVAIVACFISTQFGDSPKLPLESLYINTILSDKVKKFEQAKREYQAYLEKKKRDFWLNMDGYRFEIEVAKLYEKLGYKAKVTSKSADGGIDIILQKGDETIAVQCKHHSKPVGPNDVRALQGVTLANGYSYGIFVSLNGFTTTVPNEIRNTSDRVRIELVSLPQILQMVDLTANNSPISASNVLRQQSVSSIKQKNVVQFGSTVSVLDISSNKIEIYKILSYADLSKNIISNSSPVAIALLYHRTDDIVEVGAPNGKYKLKILDVKN